MPSKPNAYISGKQKNIEPQEQEEKASRQFVAVKTFEMNNPPPIKDISAGCEPGEEQHRLTFPVPKQRTS